MFDDCGHDGAGRCAIAGALQPRLPGGEAWPATPQLGAPISPILNGGTSMTRINRHRSSSRGLGRRLAIPASILACLGAAALVAASAPAQSTTTTDTHATGLQRDLDALVAAGAPGAILLVRNGAHTVQFTAGMSDIAHRTPIAAGDHFKIASLTKTYTATVVLQLVGEGKLSLDDSVQRRLPGVVPNGSKITIRQLLNHTSGLSDFETDPRYLKPYLAGNFAYYWSPRQLVQIGVSHKPLFAPGRGWSYSNTNYVVAQLIVERTTGKTLGAELRRRIFRPLHLDQTTYPTTPGLPNPYVHGYMLLGNPPLTDVTRLSPSLAPGSGGIVSTVGDIADFYRALFSGRLLEPAQLQAMKTTSPSAPASPSPVARDTASASGGPEAPAVAGVTPVSFRATTPAWRSPRTVGAKPS